MGRSCYLCASCSTPAFDKKWEETLVPKKTGTGGINMLPFQKAQGFPLAPGLFPEGKRHIILKFKDVNKAFVTCSTSFRT